MKDSEIPKLYKYRSFNDKLSLCPFSDEKIPQWQTCLYYGIIAFSSPESFNDPFDCDFVVDKSFLSQKAIRELFIQTIEYERPLSIQEKQLLRTAPDWKGALESILGVSFSSRIGQELMKTVNTSLRELRKDFLVACFSESNDSILMWSHYANNHSGFCIEFEFEDSPIAKCLHPVKYHAEKKLIPGTFADTDGQAATRAIFEATLNKAEEWSYEKEWRCVYTQEQLNPFPFSLGGFRFVFKDYISAVYLGANASDMNCQQVCEHFNGTNIKVYKMKLREDCYRLIPELIQ